MGALALAGQGALILLRVEPPEKGSLPADPVETLRAELESKFSLLSKYPLRLVVVDPVNAFVPESVTQNVLQRGKAAELLRNAKSNNVNLWFNSEQVDTSDSPGQFEENIADTVIHLGFEHPQGAQVRYVEVTKSRLQREQPGKHSLWITSDGGLRITARTYPGDLAIQSSTESSPDTPYDLGIPGLQKVLGPRSVVPGDIIAFDGPTGTSKTLAGVLFLTGRGSKSQSRRSLMISDFSRDRMCELVRIALEQARAAENGENAADGRPEAVAARRTADEIEMYSVPLGFVEPGRMLLDVERLLEKCRGEGRPVDRVLVANVSRWELEMPLLHGDPGFGVALIKLLRKYGITAVIVTGYLDPSRGSPLIDVILESADCQIQFSRLDFRGQDRHYIRVKTRDMNHRRGRFELLDRNRMMVMPRESLMRLAPDNKAAAVPIRIFLHSETANHDRYNNRLISALQTTLSPGIEAVPENRRYDTNVLQLSSLSVIDELQILQLDEFQLPPARPDKDAAGQFVEIDRSHVAERLPSLLKRVEGHVSGRYLAVPFYENISFLAYRKDKVALASGWADLAHKCEEWEDRANTPKNGIYFACPVARVDRYETYNCLFFEILFSFRKPPENGSLTDWLSADDAVRALMIFRKLLRRYHQQLAFADGSDERKWREQHNRLTKQALVWRVWYTTFNQSLSEITDRDRAGISVKPLFGHCGDPAGMSTSGEWYLTVPAFSAAPEVALQIIDFLTSPERELERLHLGVGLPVRSRFYTELEKLSSRYFESEDLSPAVVVALIENALRRSRLWDYPALSDILSSHLIRALYIGGKDDKEIEREVRRTLASMLNSFRSISGRGKHSAALAEPQLDGQAQ